MVQIEERFVSVAEAARLLHVSQSTVWRWINAEQLPAYRFGHKRVLVKQSDLEASISPARQGQAKKGGSVEKRERSPERDLTAGEQEGLAVAIEEANQFRAKLLAQRGGKPFPPAWEAINELRDERSREAG